MSQDSGSNNNHSDRINRLRPWQRRALHNGRTPLPEAPGQRPWLSVSSQLHGSRTDSATPLGSSSQAIPLESSSGHRDDNGTSLEQSGRPNEPVPLNYRFWPEDEMRRLILLRNSGATWAAVYAAFPNRTPEAIKQAYHKRRHPIERQMEVEATEAASSGASDDKKKGLE
ncbi:hypothetical protein FLONG3_10715 [Fusarium longipes]|uniref:Myb-like domain-containing protein n=1 Tax=Fusarium longipes TaxID=694270 RepID=A0A395RL21_9HYPO|nr:hypothetical protein FLONG3_10715 [Fusarium longipes]